MKILPSLLLSLPAAAVAGGFWAAPVADYKEDELTFGFTAGPAFVGGEAREHVFCPKSAGADYEEEVGKPAGNRRHQMSRLDWDLSAALFGVSGSVRYERLALNLGVWYGSGSDDLDMKDYDWMDGDDVRYTEYSRSDAELTDAWMFDANLSLDFWRSDGFTGFVFAGAREQRWKWTCDGRNDYWYSEYGHVWNHDRGHVCDYRQIYLFGYAGLGGTWKISESFDLTARASWAPGWKGRDRDNHIAAEKDAWGSFDWNGDVYGVGLSVGWHAGESATVSVGVDWQKATLNQGDLSQHDYDEPEAGRAEDAAGMECEYLALTVTLDWAF